VQQCVAPGPVSVAGVTAERSTLVDAPYVAELPGVLGCKVLEIHELDLHVQFIGEVLDVKFDDNCWTRTANLSWTNCARLPGLRPRTATIRSATS
jgi:flavin reductase (DIM6/NTAB) family NADH-FMN oxidoreductase RutF